MEKTESQFSALYIGTFWGKFFLKKFRTLSEKKFGLGAKHFRQGYQKSRGTV